MAFSLVLTSAVMVRGANDDNPWPSFELPAPGPARAIGTYAGGCLQGAEALPLQGAGYQVMRPSRNRFFGHPVLVDFIRTYGRRTQRAQLGALLIGDLSQARGGRAAKGHASHQTGLDVDIWYAHPPRGPNARLAPAARETLEAENVVDLVRQVIVPRWKKRVTRMLLLAAEDARVERVFVNPVIKHAMCAQPGRRPESLRKIRPWYGHADHFHVRLACPASDEACQSQPPLPPGDGCDKLGGWLRPQAKSPASVTARKPARPSGPPKALVEYRRSIAEGNGWPAQCNALLEQDHPKPEQLARAK